MNLLRFSRSEVKAMQFGIVILVIAVSVFAYLANTTILPALKNLKLEYTECRVVHSDLIFIPPESSGGGRCNFDRIPYICLQVFVVFNYIPVPTKELSKKYRMNSKGYVFDLATDISPTPVSNSQIRFGSEPKSLSIFDEKLLSEDVNQPSGFPKTYRALLHIDNSQSNFQKKCTVQPPCESDYHLLLQKMRTLQWRLGKQGMTFPCLYDIQNPKDVLLNRRYDWWSVYLSIFWPLMLLVYGLAVIVSIYCCIGRLKSTSTSTSKSTAKGSSNSQFPRGSTTAKSTSKTRMGMNKFAAV